MTWLHGLGFVLLILMLSSVLRSARCRHLDDDGRTVLMWATHRGRLCGYCDRCGRWTSGWPLRQRSWWLD